MKTILDNKICLIIKDEQIEYGGHSKGIISGYLGEGYYLINFIEWNLNWKTPAQWKDDKHKGKIIMSFGDEPLEKIINIKEMKEWEFYSTEQKFKKATKDHLLLIDVKQEYIESAMKGKFE